MMKTDFAGCNGNEAQSCPQEKSKAVRNAGAAEKANTELFEAIRKGDEKAFAEYYLKFIDNYVAFIRGIVLNEEEAREIAQDVFVYLWENRSELNPQKNLEAYLFGTAKNKAYKHIRSRTIHSKFTSERLFTADTLDIEADSYVITKETELILKRVMKNMPEQRRRVFELSRIDGMTHEEIAAHLGISRHTVHNHLTVAIKEVRAAISLYILFLLVHQ